MIDTGKQSFVCCFLLGKLSNSLCFPGDYDRPNDTFYFISFCCSYLLLCFILWSEGFFLSYSFHISEIFFFFPFLLTIGKYRGLCYLFHVRFFDSTLPWKKHLAKKYLAFSTKTMFNKRSGYRLC